MAKYSLRSYVLLAPSAYIRRVPRDAAVEDQWYLYSCYCARCSEQGLAVSRQVLLTELMECVRPAYLPNAMLAVAGDFCEGLETYFPMPVC